MATVLRDAVLVPGANVVVLDDAFRPLDGLLLLRPSGRAAVRASTGAIVVLGPGSGRLRDDDLIDLAVRYARHPPTGEPEPDLAARLAAAEAHRAATVHLRVWCQICGAQPGERCVYRAAGEPDQVMDYPHDDRVRIDGGAR